MLTKQEQRNSLAFLEAHLSDVANSLQVAINAGMKEPSRCRLWLNAARTSMQYVKMDLQKVDSQSYQLSKNNFMSRQNHDLFYSQVNSIEIAEEIIQSLPESKIKQTFLVFLESAKTDTETWNILRERLAGWLCKNQPHMY